MKKTTLQDMRDILVDSKEGSDRHFWGVVTRQNRTASGDVTSYEVALGGDEGTMTCRKLAGADVGDTVMVTLTKTGMAVVTGTVDGDKDAEAAMTTAEAAQGAVDTLSETVDTLADDVDSIEGLVGDGDETGITITTQYYLSTSNTTQTGGTWSDTLPAYVAGRYYWTKTITTYADGSEVESTPVLDVAAQISAETAAVATATDQHFWSDSSGAYVTKSNKSLTSGYAMKITTNGLLQTYNNKNLMSLTSSGLSLYQSDGSTLLASYSSGGAYMYAGGSLGASVTSSGMNIYSGSNLAASITSSGSTFYSGGSAQTSISAYGIEIKTGYGLNAFSITKGSTKLFSAGAYTNSSTYAEMTLGGFTLTEYSSYYQITADASIRITPSILINNGVSAYNIYCTSSNSSGDAVTADNGSIKNLWAVTNATSAGNNMHMGTQGRIYMVSGSSKRWKNSIEDIHDEALDPHRLYDIDVKQFKFNTDYIKDKTDQRYDTLVPGFIAEQIQEHYPVAVDVDMKTGEVMDWNMKMVIPPMLALIQEQKKEIDSIRKELADIKKLIA